MSLVLLAIFAYVVFIACFYLVQFGYCKFPAAYGGGSQREPAVPRRVSDPNRDQYAELVKCPPEGPFVFVPEVQNADVAPNAVHYFQTRLKLPRDRVFECATKLVFSHPGALVGFYVGHLEFFSDVVSGTVHDSDPFIIDASPDAVITLSVRNRGSEPLTIAAWHLTLTRKS